MRGPHISSKAYRVKRPHFASHFFLKWCVTLVQQRQRSVVTLTVALWRQFFFLPLKQIHFYFNIMHIISDTLVPSVAPQLRVCVRVFMLRTQLIYKKAVKATIPFVHAPWRRTWLTNYQHFILQCKKKKKSMAWLCTKKEDVLLKPFY